MRTIIRLLLISNCSLLIIHSQWQPDVRLTYNPAPSQYPSVSVFGQFVHVVWEEFRDGNWETYYKLSTDNGVNWGADTRLTNDTADSRSPDISVSGSNVHVVWDDRRDGNNEIYYKLSTDNGINWSTDNRLTNDPAFSRAPSVSVSGVVVHVVWQEYRNGNRDIYYKRSTVGGIYWEADKRLTYDSLHSYAPDISVSSQTVHIVWYDDRDGYNKIYYKRSTDEGINWGADTRLSDNVPFNAYAPAVSVFGQIVHVVWHDYRDGNPEIYYKRSTDAGLSWGTDTRLTNFPGWSYEPSIIVSGPIVHVVWQDERDGNFFEIYYKRSTNGGLSWDTDIRLTNNPNASLKPSISVSGSIVHVVWMDSPEGMTFYEIYYKRDPTGNLLSIKNIYSGIPKEFGLFQNYPNPFNPSTKILFSIPLSGGVSEGDGLPAAGRGVLLIIYDVLGREIQKLVNEQLSPGTYEVEFDGSNYSSGIYYYKIDAGDYAETKKMVLIK